MSSRLLIDCSSTITCEFNSGIQRVVRNLCEQAGDPVNRRRPAVPVYGRAGQLYKATSLYPEQPSDWASAIADSRAAEIYRKLAEGVNRRVSSRRFEKLFLPKQGHSGIFKLPKLTLKNIQKLQSSLTNHPQPPIEVQAGDVLLMADASWMEPNWETIEMAKHRGAIVGNLVYDLIPISHPQFFPSELVERFTQWFGKAVQSSDFFLCISEHVASQVQQRLCDAGRGSEELETLCRSFPLGGNLTSRQNAIGFASESFQTLFGEERQENPFLMVGTLEPRKNHAFVLDAFDELWKSGCQEKLCIVGRVGWNCEATLNRIRQHAEFERKLFLFNDASDADVSLAYRRAKSLIMASHTEGFGLPIVEALEFGQNVLASSTPIHREVGRDCVSCFGIEHGCEPLMELIRTSRATVGIRQSATPTPCVQWSESFAAIWEATARVRQHLLPTASTARRTAA